MTLKVIDEINSRLKNLHRKNKSFSSVRQRLLRNAPFNLTLIIHTQPDILISKKSKSSKINTFGSVWSYTERPTFLKRILKLLLTGYHKKTFNQSMNSIVFKYFTNQSPIYFNEVFESAYLNNLRARNTYLHLTFPFQKINTGQNLHSFIGSSVWNKTPEVFKKVGNMNTSNITLKRYYLTQIR